MAHWAELDENNIVLRVTVGNNDDPAGDEGYSWLIENLGGRWIKTSYNGNIRKNFATVGSFYDETLDIFINQKPFPSWILDPETGEWVAPIQHPEDDESYIWDESSISWKLLENN